jgi:tRNA-Thr(GGU) m(6)t(6)A37 methyltransferase TsaA
MDPLSLTLAPIGYIRTPYADRYRAPRQPGTAAEGAGGEIVLEANMNFEQALDDLKGFDFIWVIYWFHRNSTWKPKVLPPRGERVKRGVFATRSPHRPNPIGLSLLRLVGIDGRTIRVADVDLLDGTPILDIKPYLPYAEAFPDAAAGWLDAAIESERDGYTVVWSRLARQQAVWLQEHHGIALAEVAVPILERDPSPHPYRRITPRRDGGLQLAIKSWRLIVHVADRTVHIDRIESGYSPERVAAANEGELHDGEAHAGFYGVWGG